MPVLKADLVVGPGVRENSVRRNGVVRDEIFDFTTGRVEQPHVGAAVHFEEPQNREQ